ncbi:MAG TPA: hypothetical protein P5560_00885 [Thermotogota bacterium]|nr:hypothetical protein [Thermotogota bacterium]HRW91482.1 hypothetical protein [Thermotogota bacterium]
MNKRPVPILVLLSTLLFLVFSSTLLAEEETLHIQSERFRSSDDRFDFLGYTEIRKNQFQLIGDRFYITLQDGKEETAVATQGIFVSFESGQATALTLDYDFESEKGTLTGDVVSQILSQTSEGTQTIDILCQRLGFSTRDESYDGDSAVPDRVQINKGSLEAFCNQFQYDGRSESLLLERNVDINDPENKRSIQASQVQLDLQTDGFTASEAFLRVDDASSDPGKTLVATTTSMDFSESRIDFLGPSTLQKGDLLLRSRSFFVLREGGVEKTLQTRAPVFIEFESGEATANHLDYDLESQTGVLSEAVQAKIQSGESTDTVLVNCEQLHIDTPSRRYEGEGSEESPRIEIQRTDFYGNAGSFVFLGDQEEVILEDQVYVELEEDKFIRQGEYVKIFLKDNTLQAKNSSIQLSSETGNPIQIQTKDFEILDDSIQFYDTSRLTKGKTQFVSDRFEVLREGGKERTLQATDGAFIAFESGSATSNTITFDLETETGTLTHDVNAQIQTGTSTETVNILCDQLLVDAQNKEYQGFSEGSDRLSLRKGELEAKSDRFFYDGNSEVIELVGNVWVLDPKNRRELQGENVKIHLKDDSLEAVNATMTLITKQ